MAEHDDEARHLADTYFRAWRDRDFEALRTILADNVTFTGPLGQVTGVEDYLESMKAMREHLTDIVVTIIAPAGDDVLTWFELHTADAPPSPVVNWTHVADHKIDRVQVTFDPRPFLGS